MLPVLFPVLCPVRGHESCRCFFPSRLKSNFPLEIAGGFCSVVFNVAGAIVPGACPKLLVGSPVTGCFTGLAGFSA